MQWRYRGSINIIFFIKKDNIYNIFDHFGAFDLFQILAPDQSITDHIIILSEHTLIIEFIYKSARELKLCITFRFTTQYYVCWIAGF